jgi:hypothetical protein
MDDEKIDPVSQTITLIHDAAPEQIDYLVEAATALSPTAAISNYVDAIVAGTGWQSAKVRSLVRAVLSFLGAAYQASIPKEDRPERFLRPSSMRFDDDGSELESRLGRVLSIPSLCIRAKADFLARAHNNELLSSLIVTDQRPIYGDSVDDGEQGVMIYENLNLTYLEAGREFRSLSLACDFRDLQSLRDQINRAIEKHKNMEVSLLKSDRQVWFASEGDDEGED